jgi:hypothetical protein
MGTSSVPQYKIRVQLTLASSLSRAFAYRKHPSTMEFPLDWKVSEAAEFDVTTPTSPGAVSVELFAQLRNTGRILDGFRFAIDGASPLEVNVDLYQLIPVDDCRSLRFFQQSWPRDVALRRNMVSSTWTSLTDTVSSNNADILDDSGRVPPDPGPAPELGTGERLDQVGRRHRGGRPPQAAAAGIAPGGLLSE